MGEIKKVVVLNGEIINVGELEVMPEGATVEEREMYYTLEHGWLEVGHAPPTTKEDFFLDLELRMTLLELGLTL